MTRRSLRSAAIIGALAILAGFAPAVLQTPAAATSAATPLPDAATGRRLLAAAASRLAVRIDALPDPPPADALFEALESWRRDPGAGAPALLAASVWDEEGRPLAWSGRPSLAAPQPPPAAAVVIAGADAVASARRLLAWSPIAAGGAVLVESGAPSPDAAAATVPGTTFALTLAGAMLLALLLCLSWRRGGGRGSRGALAMTAGVWGLRALLAVVTRLGSPLAPALATPALFASAAPWGLFRSPLDALLTGLAATAQAGLLVRWLRARDRPGPLRLALAGAGLLALAAAVGLSARAGLDSRLDLSGLGGDEISAAQLALQLGLVLTLWGPAMVVAAALPGLRAGRGPWLAALLAMAAAVLVFAHAARSAEAARQDLVTEHLAPMLRRQSEDRTAALLESRAQLASWPGLADDLAVASRLGTGRDLAFRLWQRTELAALGYRSSLELLDADGRLLGSFALEMPPPLPAGPGGEAALFDVPLERLVFATLSQEEEVLSTRWTVGSGEGALAGGVALYVADEVDNLPALMDEPDLPAWAAAGRDVRRILGGAPIVMVHDGAGRLLWSALTDPPPLPIHAGEPVWLSPTYGGRTLRLLRFSDGERVITVGYRLHSWSRLAARLLRFVLLQGMLLAALGLAALILLRPAPGWRADLALLRSGITTSWGRKLAVVVLLASMAPLLSLALLLRAPMARQRAASLAALGLQSADVARRVVLDAMVAVGGDEPDAIPSDETLYWLSRVVRQDIDLFVDWRLVATSRRGLFTAGLASPLPDAAAYRRIALAGGQVSLPVGPQEADVPPAVTAALKLPDGRLALLRLPFRRQEAAVQQAGDEVRERADLATAGVALLLVGAAVAVGRGTARRLRRLTDATERLARGDETVQVDDPAADELGRLTLAFNRMAAALASRRADLKRRTETLESLVRHAPTGIVHLDGSGRLLMVNPAAARLLGQSMEDLRGAGPEELLAASPFAESLGRLLAAPDPAAGVPLLRDLSPDDRGETRLRAVLVRLPESRGDRLLLLEDITESVRSGRLAAWADMARRIAHEIKNPLTPIRLSAEHLLRVRARGGDLDATLERTLRTILDQVEALRGIAADFSLYARLPEKRPQRILPATLVQETLAPYRDAAPPGVRFAVELAPDLPAVLVDPALMRRVLVNLLENALQAMPHGGTLGVRGRLDGNSIELVVSDTGVGMDAATLERIFEPYFSTRDAGTGLGLAIARRTVEDHGGRILARSTPGAGTRFIIRLPAADTSDPSR